MSSRKNGVRFIEVVSSSGGESGGGRSKARKRNSSDSPSASATNEHGCDVVQSRLRSVLCHPLGLSLMYALNGKDLSKLKCLAKEQHRIDDVKSLNNILSASVEQWRTMGGRRTEDKLTKEIARRTSMLSKELGYFAHPEVYLYDTEDNQTNPRRIDVLLSPSREKIPDADSEISNPYAVIEFGLNGMDWSKKLDQNVKYIDRMVNGKLTNRNLLFELPILCAVVTVEDNDGVFDFKLGVFLCSRRDLDDPRDRYRMSLLWNARTNDLKESSTLFGRLLQVTHDFKFWITDIDGFAKRNKYMYLSSSCCRCTINRDRANNNETSTIEDGSDGNGNQAEHDNPNELGNQDGDVSLGERVANGARSLPYSEPRDQSAVEEQLVVLRSYDNRVRKSLRNPEIYLDAICQEKVGVGTTFCIANLHGDKHEDIETLEAAVMELNPLESALWEQMGKRNLTIIGTPYRPGRHYAATPKAFVPLVRQVKRLHEAGYGHGDIRAYNLVFGEDPKEGWMIDFDFGGRLDEALYPEGYKRTLNDGTRIGEAGDAIKAMDDWYALGQLIFNVHRIKKVEDEDLKEFWLDVQSLPTPEQIKKLEDFLLNTDLPVTPSSLFAKSLTVTKQISGDSPGAPKKTVVGATGTPYKKK